MCHKNPVATATAPVAMTTSRHVKVSRSPLMGWEETRMMTNGERRSSQWMKKTEACPLLATSEWCRSHPAIIRGRFCSNDYIVAA